MYENVDYLLDVGSSGWTKEDLPELFSLSIFSLANFLSSFLPQITEYSPTMINTAPTILQSVHIITFT